MHFKERGRAEFPDWGRVVRGELPPRPAALPHVIDRTVTLVSDILSFHMVLRWFSR